MATNPFEVGTGDEFVPLHDSAAVEPSGSAPVEPSLFLETTTDVFIEIPAESCNIDTVGPFPFPPEAQFKFQIYGRMYTINPKHLLICPNDWLGAADNGVLDSAIEAADSWIVAVYQAYLDARVRLELLKRNNETAQAGMRKRAELTAIETIKKEVTDGKRDKFKSPTIDDIESTKLRVFGEDLAKMRAQEVQLECEMLRLEDLHRTLRNRSFILDKISARLHADKTRR